MKQVIRRLSLIILLALLSGCWISGQFEPKWDARFEKYTYASSNSTESYYIGDDGIYRYSDSMRIIATDYEPDAICVNDRWIVCLVKPNDDKYSLDPLCAITYQIDNHEMHTFKTNSNHYTGILLTDNDELVIVQEQGYCAFNLEQRIQIELPLLWESTYELEGFHYNIKVYQPDSRKIGILTPLASSSYSDFAVLTEYGNYGTETGTGYAVLEITDDSAHVISVKNIPNYAYAVYEVKNDNTCTELFSLPNTHNGNTSLKYQFGSCVTTSDGMHILTMRKMNGWNKTETPSEFMYVGDAAYIVSSDWLSYQMLDLGSKKLIGSEEGTLYYIENNVLYRTSVDTLQELSFEELEILPRDWIFISFTKDDTYCVFLGNKTSDGNKGTVLLR